MKTSHDFMNEIRDDSLEFFALVLALALTSCARTPSIIIDDHLTYPQHEQMGMVPEPSAQSTNESLWMDMQGEG
jgi:hypothetical protein